MRKLISGLSIGIFAFVMSASSFGLPAGIDRTPETDITAGVNGKFWILQKDLKWIIGGTKTEIVVPRGFVTDYASIPQALWGVVKPRGQYDRAAIIHDYLYWSQGCTREQADRLMVIAMKESNVGWFDAVKIYKGLEVGGLIGWNSNARERAEGKIKVVTADYLIPSDPNMSWPDYRTILMGKGVKDPIFQEAPPYCKYGDTTDVPAQDI